MDLVITYVDYSNLDWQRNYINTQISSYPMYFRTHKDSLKYLLRGVHQYLPFIETVYLVVQNLSEVPDYIDTSVVKVVLHEDIIPKKYLPVFNSCVIEWFLPNIKNLSDLFLYCNDDMFITAPISKECFYQNGIINTWFGNLPEDHPFTQGIIKNSSLLVYGKPRTITPQHIIRCYSKDTFQTVFHNKNIEIIDSFTAFRDNDKNICIYAIDYYQDSHGISQPLNPKISYQFLTNENIDRRLDNIILGQHQLLVLSDVCETPDIWQDTNLLQLMQNFYTVISKYEKKEDE